MTRSVATRTISHAECQRIIARVHSEAARLGIGATIAIVDPGGTLKALSRTDDAFQPWAVGVAIGKAQTALNAGCSTRELWEKVQADAVLMANVPTMPEIQMLPGGVLIRDGEFVIGALGVGGTAFYGEDEQMCAAGLRDDGAD